MREWFDKWSKNELMVAIIGAIVGAIASGVVTYFVTVITASGNPMIERYFAIDTASTLIDSYLVDMGYVDDSILDVESLDQQFKIIHDSFAQYENAVELALVNMGEKQESVNGMHLDKMLANLPNLAKRLADSCADIDKEIEEQKKENNDLKDENAELKKQNDEYKQRKEAEVLGACLIIDGECMNNGESINNAMVKVDGHYYYEETFIESYLRKEVINYNVQNQTIIVGDSLPEKVKFAWDKMAFNPHGIDNYQLSDNSTFSMAKKTYSEGIVLSENDYFYVQLDGKYSKMSFTYGHVDDTNLGDLELTFFAVDDNNEAYHNVLKTITLPGEMTTKEIEVPIGYANTIKVVVSDGDDWDSDRASFGLTNIYLYS